MCIRIYISRNDRYIPIFLEVFGNLRKAIIRILNKPFVSDFNITKHAKRATQSGFLPANDSLVSTRSEFVLYDFNLVECYISNIVNVGGGRIEP